METTNCVRVAFGQLTPVLFDKEKTVKKVCDAILEAGKNGAKLILFPEAFLGAGYPRGMNFGIKLSHRKLKPEKHIATIMKKAQSMFRVKKPKKSDRLQNRPECML
jgi:nitrilase